MKVYVRVLVLSNIARRQEHQNEYIYVHIQPITFLLHTRYFKKVHALKFVAGICSVITIYDQLQ